MKGGGGEYGEKRQAKGGGLISTSNRDDTVWLCSLCLSRELSNCQRRCCRRDKGAAARDGIADSVQPQIGAECALPSPPSIGSKPKCVSRSPLSALHLGPFARSLFPPLHGSVHGNPLLREKRLCSGVSEFGGACTVIWDLAWRPSARLKGSARGSKASSARPCIGLCVQTATVKSERLWSERECGSVDRDAGASAARDPDGERNAMQTTRTRRGRSEMFLAHPSSPKRPSSAALLAYRNLILRHRRGSLCLFFRFDSRLAPLRSPMFAWPALRGVTAHQGGSGVDGVGCGGVPMSIPFHAMLLG
ncbi:hypothetical protein L1887_60495 [Cichorium endivia]|nr:hypothetical protein L1887_60495 [Cichorium endivia]